MIVIKSTYVWLLMLGVVPYRRFKSNKSKISYKKTVLN